MSDPFVAEIKIFAGNFAPLGWAFCDGQLLPLSQNTALFSLVGTTYGGNGSSNFALPNLQGRAPMHPGRGPGLTERQLGDRGGAEMVTLTETQMPQHTHALQGVNVPASSNAPGSALTLARSAGGFAYKQNATADVTFDTEALLPAGGSQAHNNMQPYLTLNFIIALQGLYPSRG